MVQEDVPKSSQPKQSHGDKGNNSSSPALPNREGVPCQVSGGDEISESAALIDRARAGSDSALGRLLENCRDYLLMVANEEVADDIRQKVAASDLVQETLAEACEGFGKFRGQSHKDLMAWLKRILLNNVTDAGREYRRTAKRDVGRERSINADDSTDALRDELIADQSTPSGHLIAAEEHQRLLRKLEQLPAHYREIIERRNLEFHSFVEIGQQMKLSADSARKLWDRAIVCLAKELSIEDGEP